MLLGKSPSVWGGTLYPLNELKYLHSELFREKKKKYEGRMHTLEQHIPHLDCKWGDVVFLSPVHPNILCAALAKCMEHEMPSFPYYEIPVENLSYRKMAYWHFNSEYTPSEVEPFDSEKYAEIKLLPEKTISYFLEQKRKEERPLFYVHIPHVLYKGTIDVSCYQLQYTEKKSPL